MISEERIIVRLQSYFNSSGGIGDDAALIPIDNHRSYVISKDLLVEDTHFRRSYYDPESLAHKAFHVNLSDMAAMGAKPAYVLLGISFPSNLASAFVDRFLDSFSTQCKTYGVLLIGGDTTASPDKIFISVTIIGSGENNDLKFRHSAHPGDIVYVAGQLGDAHAGLATLEAGNANFDVLKARALKPMARIQEGLWFAQKAEVTAMMDISDGLYTDLRKLCSASKTGSDIFVDALQPSAELRTLCKETNADPLEYMLAGGEDYGLLITVRPEAEKDLVDDFSKKFHYQLQHIGQITSTSSIRLMKNNHEIPFTYQGFTHF